MKERTFCGLCFALLLGAVFLLLSCGVSPPLNNEAYASDAIEPGDTNVDVLTDPSGLNESAQYFIDHGLIQQDDYAAELYLTRNAAVRMIADVTSLSAQAQSTSYTHPFIDLSTGTEPLIGFLYHNNIIQGVTNNHFMGDEICDEDTFLVFLLRAINFAGGGTGTFDRDSAYQTAKEAGILLANDENDDKVLSVNDAFDLCYNALFAKVGDNKQTLLSILTDSGAIMHLDSDNAGDFSDAYEIAWPSMEPLFQDNFNDDTLKDHRIYSKSGSTNWYGGFGAGALNSITADGYLEMTGEEQNLLVNEQYALLKKHLQGNESYGMTFTVNVQSMPNEGNENRVIFRVIPRTADAAFTKYYAVNYFIVQQLGEYESNLIRCKWSITNTNAPSGTAPLAEAYFLLREKVDYTARLLIENTPDGNVHIAFYIDGPDRPTADTAPLLEYTDASEYRILQSVMGPALGISGSLNSGWGFAARVQFDNVALYDVSSFAALNAQLEHFADTPVVMDAEEPYAEQLCYLIRRGVILPSQRKVDFDETISVKELLATALYYNGRHMLPGQTMDAFVDAAYQTIFRRTEIVKNTDYDRPVTRYEAAMILQKLLPGKSGSSKYQTLYADALKPDYKTAVYFAVQNSYLLLDESNRFNGEATITRSELLRMLALAADARLRTNNSVLTIQSIYSDYAVIQAGKPILVSGRGMSGDTVTVRFGTQQLQTKVVDGAWSVEFPAQTYGGPYALKISDSGFIYKYRGIYVGEVVVVAGQSNAEMPLYDTNNVQDMLEKYAHTDKIRFYQPDSKTAIEPVTLLPHSWSAVVDPFSAYIVGSASAIGVYYVDQLLTLNADLKDVKFGIIQLTYGGTSIEMFMPNNVNVKNGYVQQDDEFIRSGFWNGYMEGVTPYNVSALLYYQGENSTQLKYMYEPLLRDYIWGVRQAFDDESLPVLLVQLSGYGDNYGQNGDYWPYIREVQMRVANTTENVGVVATIDLAGSNPQEIHPADKQPIGSRLAYLAMDLVYGKDLGMQSCVMTSYERKSSVYTIHFNATALTLDETVAGTRDFEVMTADGTWVDAEAKAEGDTLLVWSDEVIVPHGVRYAWSNFPKADLFDQNGLPVLPFNTTKDLNTPVDESELTTTSHLLKKAYHLLQNGDAVVNVTRDNAFRHVQVINAYMLEYTDGDIPGQAPGDEVALLKKQADGLLAGDGTGETIVYITAHGLKAGDWLYNTKYEVMTRVLEVIDENSIRVERVIGQSSGDLFVVYRCIADTSAEK